MTCAIILAAGCGSRLRPLTHRQPKCLVPFLGQSLISWQIQTLQKAKIDPIVVVGGYKYEMLKELGIKVLVNEHYDSTNMVESLFCAKEILLSANEDVIISYGDIIYQKDNLESLLQCDAPIAAMIDQNWHKLWALRFKNVLDDAESLKFDQQKNIYEIGKKVSSLDHVKGQYTGLVKVSRKFLRRFVKFYEEFPSSTKNIFMTSFLQHLIDQGQEVKAVLVEGGWLEIDTFKDLKKYQDLKKNHSLDAFFTPEFL